MRLFRQPEGIAFFVPRGLGEHTAQLDFARMSRLAVGFTFAALGFFLHYRYAGSVHLHIGNRHRLADEGGQIQLDGFADFDLLAFGDVGAQGFRRALHRFGSHFQTSQNSHLLTAVIEGRLLAD